jgi:hypothetical protein
LLEAARTTNRNLMNQLNRGRRAEPRRPRPVPTEIDKNATPGNRQ